ncbi:acylphosphatase [Candidatus Woesearchaeota archaeon]|nr:acylphosphatase [Candidatus Woesearchaeota archaeon]
MNRRVHILIKGKVQGVFFRAAIEDKAKALHITGWAKNTGDDVEALFEGKDEAIKEILEFCVIGPKGAKLTGIDIDELPYTGEFEDFTRE